MSVRRLIGESTSPVVMAAFGGWSDAACSATNALRYLSAQLCGEIIRVFETDDFYDYQVNRPHQRLTDDGASAIDWPHATLRRMALDARAGGAGRALYTLDAPEPSFRWRAFCDQLLPTLAEIQPLAVVVLGAMIGQTPHTRPLPTSVTVPLPALSAALDVPTTEYEGDVGITSVFARTCAAVGLTTLSMWTTVPNYLADDFDPGMLSLLHCFEDTTGLVLPLDKLRSDVSRQSYEYDRMTAEDEDITAYVRELERHYDESAQTGEQLAVDFQRYLREQDPGE